MTLTPRQKQVLDFLVDFQAQHGYSPSYEEIGQALNLSSLATIHKHITALVEKKYVRRRYNESRSVEVADEYKSSEETRKRQQAVGEVPLLGRIVAGAPLEAVAGRDTLQFGDFMGSGENFALEVRGDSMIEDHILNGDFVLVERASTAKDGEIVVALVDGSETTLKRFYHEGEGLARLQPANASMEPIRVPLDRVEVQGRVLAVLRKYR
jgi:repressor LexA